MIFAFQLRSFLLSAFLLFCWLTIPPSSRPAAIAAKLAERLGGGSASGTRRGVLRVAGAAYIPTALRSIRTSRSVPGIRRSTSGGVCGLGVLGGVL